eukprot:TRINITY_DN380_c0_g1_i3.p1 TRINITY_DN380_c0_g1~~TRINITY_DN380_c0_g1_i3.p1  ORF type:complete len:373 (+),score=63.11 TRINITY_DN380_c0_g1_i3:491-1609(+)
MSPKKQHEVLRLAPLISLLSQRLNTNVCIDLGAGQGYLSDHLAIACDLQVVAIEGKDNHTQGASNRSKALAKLNSKGGKSKTMGQSKGNVSHITKHLSTDESWGDLKPVLPEQMANVNTNALLIGLHTCGDLASTLLRLFASSPSLTACVDVGCCYNLLTDAGYPLSNYVKDKKLILPTAARMAACQALERWGVDRDADELMFTKHSYRAILQVLITEGLIEPNSNMDVRHEDAQTPPKNRVGRVRKRNMTFVEYAKIACQKLNARAPPDLILEERYERLREEAETLPIFWTLRALVGPIVESLLMMDRLMFIGQHESMSGMILPLFDPRLSPRNLVVIGFDRSRALSSDTSNDQLKREVWSTFAANETYPF